MANMTHLDIVSAEKAIFSGLIEMVVATAELGEMGIIAGHAPLLTMLVPGEVRIVKQDGVEEVFYISGGMLEVQPYAVTVLADVVKRADELDEAAANEAKAHAEAQLAKQSAEIDYSLAAAELAQAVAQIRAIHKLRKKLHQ